MKFKLPRKRKKQYKKNHSKIYYSKEYYEWFYFRRRVEVRGMEVILNYPKTSTNKELLEWYQTHHPNDKLAHHYCKQNRHKWDKYNTKN